MYKNIIRIISTELLKTRKPISKVPTNGEIRKGSNINTTNVFYIE